MEGPAPPVDDLELSLFRNIGGSGSDYFQLRVGDVMNLKTPFKKQLELLVPNHSELTIVLRGRVEK